MMEYGHGGLFRALMPLVLASGSPRRQDFLRMLGLAFTIRTAEDAEPMPLHDEQPEVYVRRAAEAKARGVASLAPESVIIAADTVVALDGVIMGKPESPAEALAMLRRLSGRVHTVASGCCVLLPGGKRKTFHAITRVTMWDAPDEALGAYVRSGEPMDKAGAYGIQGIGGFLVKQVEGSWSNVVGLPLAELVSLLLHEQAIEPFCAADGCTLG